jgi:hypothetical protein
VTISGGAKNNSIVGNVISGNTDNGVNISGSGTTGNLVGGNRIGICGNGTSSCSNGGNGVLIQSGAQSNTVGGSSVTSRNVISGNISGGVRISGSGVSSNIVAGNYIGTDQAGSGTIPNGGSGVSVEGSASGNTVGGTAGLSSGACTGACNKIWSNTGAGIQLASGTNNAFRGNSIYGNSGLGIDIGPAGVTPNDPGDGDTGANNLQNFPAITSVAWDGANTVVVGTLDSAASASFVIELFGNTLPDSSNYGEGQTYLGALNYTTPPAGFPAWALTVPGYWRHIAATATNVAGNTSEFSGMRDMDGDGDGYVDSNDCAPANAAIYPNAPEINDGLDNQCPGDPGYGAVDEISGTSGFPSPGDTTQFGWVAQGGTTSYDVLRSTTEDFSSGCTLFSTNQPFIVDPQAPPAGGTFYYLVRPTSPYRGSWGQNSDGTPRTVGCLTGTDLRRADSEAGGRLGTLIAP